MASGRVLELANMIAQNTATVNDYLLRNHLPTPSFDVTQPPIILINFQDKEVEEARMTVLEATTELNALMKGPVESLIVDVCIASIF